MWEFGSIIEGRQTITGQWIEITNPYTGNIVGRVSSADRARTQAVIGATRAARINLPRHERSSILNRMAARLELEAGAVSRMITDESGLSCRDTLYEVGRAADVLRFAAIQCLLDDSEVFPCDVSAHGGARRIYTMRQPRNLLVAITPFNHPLNTVIHKVAPAIATNNKIILKPSPQTPISAHFIAQVALDCGLPPNALNVLCGSTTDVAETLVQNKSVDMITFTGSTETGRRIVQLAGSKRLVLELGGSSAMLILADADIDQAVDISIAGVFKNSGQRCTAIRRILVHAALADSFASRLAEKVAAIPYGNPYDPAIEVGTVISDAAAAKIEQRVEATWEAGAAILTGHRRQGALYAPTVLDHVRNDHPVATGETFGPVANIIRFSNLDEAIQIANDTIYGLSAAVVSNHWPSIQRVITEIETGTVNVNAPPSFRLEWSPFGGVKESGLGDKEGVIEAMRSMTYVKTYSLPWQTP